MRPTTPWQAILRCCKRRLTTTSRSNMSSHRKLLGRTTLSPLAAISHIKKPQGQSYRHLTQYIFLTADFSLPILGIDFLSTFALKVDTKHHIARKTPLPYNHAASMHVLYIWDATRWYRNQHILPCLTNSMRFPYHGLHLQHHATFNPT